MKAVVLDTETTGVDSPDVIQLAYVQIGMPADVHGEHESVTEQWFRPRKPITMGALATHHLLDEDLEHFEPWPGRWELPPDTGYLIGHHVDFDWQAIGSPAVKRIDTCALSRHMWDQCDSHSLVAINYFLASDRRFIRALAKGAHDAKPDVRLTLLLLRRIIDELKVPWDWESLWKSSEEARIPKRMGFGKWGPKDGKPGLTFDEIREVDYSYLQWILRQPDMDPYVKIAAQRALWRG